MQEVFYCNDFFLLNKIFYFKLESQLEEFHSQGHWLALASLGDRVSLF